MSLIDLVQPEIVKVPVVATSKTGVILELLETLVAAGKIADTDAVFAALLEREGQGSTGLEKGIAVPHCKTAAVTAITLAIGIAPAGIDFGAHDGLPSNLFFLLLAPPGHTAPHVQVLAEIARLSRSQVFCRMLLAATSAAEVVELFLAD